MEEKNLNKLKLWLLELLTRLLEQKAIDYQTYETLAELLEGI